MRFKMAFMCVLLFCAVDAGFAQQASDNRRRRYVLAPPEYALLAIASQPDCPLEFVEPRVLLDADSGGAAFTYRLRNRGTNALRIRAYTVTVKYSVGNGSTWGSPASADYLVMPGQQLPEVGESEQIIPLTNELRDRLNIRGPLRGVAVLMIESIEFADGSRYNGRPISEALEAHFNDTAPRPERRN